MRKLKLVSASPLFFVVFLCLSYPVWAQESQSSIRHSEVEAYSEESWIGYSPDTPMPSSCNGEDIGIWDAWLEVPQITSMTKGQFTFSESDILLVSYFSSWLNEVNAYALRAFLRRDTNTFSGAPTETVTRAYFGCFVWGSQPEKKVTSVSAKRINNVPGWERLSKSNERVLMAVISHDLVGVSMRGPAYRGLTSSLNYSAWIKNVNGKQWFYARATLALYRKNDLSYKFEYKFSFKSPIENGENCPSTTRSVFVGANAENGAYYIHGADGDILYTIETDYRVIKRTKRPVASGALFLGRKFCAR